MLFRQRTSLLDSSIVSEKRLLIARCYHDCNKLTSYTTKQHFRLPQHNLQLQRIRFHRQRH